MTAHEKTVVGELPGENVKGVTAHTPLEDVWVSQSLAAWAGELFRTPQALVAMASETRKVPYGAFAKGRAGYSAL
jgi:hypothetical protein